MVLKLSWHPQAQSGNGNVRTLLHLSVRQLGFALVSLIAVCVLGFGIFSYTSSTAPDQIGREPSLKELQSQLAQLNLNMEELNSVKERYADLATPGPIKNTLSSNASNNTNTSVSFKSNQSAVEKDLPTLIKEAELMNTRLQKAEKDWLQQLNLLSQLPTGTPIANSAGLSSNYGTRIDPYSRQMSYHAGVDFSAPVGTPILATGDGKVTKVDFDRSNGQYVEIEHAQGFTSKYAHVSKFLVRSGDIITRGQVIAEVGSTGKSTGPHLHYEILYQGVPFNPMEALISNPGIKGDRGITQEKNSSPASNRRLASSK